MLLEFGDARADAIKHRSCFPSTDFPPRGG
jgi:hypothetical protein